MEVRSALTQEETYVTQFSVATFKLSIQRAPRLNTRMVRW